MRRLPWVWLWALSRYRISMSYHNQTYLLLNVSVTLGSCPILAICRPATVTKDCHCQGDQMLLVIATQVHLVRSLRVHEMRRPGHVRVQFVVRGRAIGLREVEAPPVGSQTNAK